MVRINLPLLDIPAEEIYEKCINGYKSKDKTDKLKKHAKRIAADSKKYLLSIPHAPQKLDIEKTTEDNRKELIKTYNEKFAKQGSSGRGYYDRIMSNAQYGLCPLCGVNQADTLDHYLPKSSYPTLSFTPSNLIPACSSCNHSKGAASNLSNMPIHAYLDDIPKGKWLHVDMPRTPTILYYVSCPANWDSGLCRRIENHFKIYKLKEKYATQAAVMIAERTSQWKECYRKAGWTELQHALLSELSSVEAVDENSWKAALLRNLSSSEQAMKQTIGQQGQ